MVLCVAAAGVGGGFLLPRSALQQKSSLAVDSLSGLGESPNQAIPPSVQVALLNQRVAQLEQSVAKQVSSVSSNEHPVLENTDMPPTPEDGIKRAAELIRQHEHAVDSEALDPKWAPQAKGAFESDLAGMSKSSDFKVLDVQCKTTQCRATIRWKTYSDTLATSSRLVESGYSTNCAKTIFTPPPENSDMPYEATVFYDCTSVRTGDVH